MIDKKNKFLAKKNTELMEEINKLNKLHTEMLKENIKNKYFSVRTYEKIYNSLTLNIEDLKKILNNSIEIKDKFVEYSKLFSNENINCNHNDFIEKNIILPKTAKNLYNEKEVDLNYTKISEKGNIFSKEQEKPEIVKVDNKNSFGYINENVTPSNKKITGEKKKKILKKAANEDVLQEVDDNIIRRLRLRKNFKK